MSNPSNLKKSVEVRQELVTALKLDIVGPDNDHPFARELLPEAPNRWYLTGFLVPTNAPIAQRFDETSVDEIDSAVDSEGTDDAVNPDRQAANRRSLLPSSMGLSVLIPEETSVLKARISWGEYVEEYPNGHSESVPANGSHSAQDDGQAQGTAQATPRNGSGGGEPQNPAGWRRIPRNESMDIPIPKGMGKAKLFPVPNSGKLSIAVTVRRANAPGLPEGTRVVSVFLVNSRTPDEENPWKAFIFQVCLELHCPEGFVARPDPRASDLEDEWDQRVADIQYRDVFEFAVGHGVSAEAVVSDGRCGLVRSIWMPTAEVERIEPSPIEDVELGMEALGSIADGTEANEKLRAMTAAYRKWIQENQGAAMALSGTRAQTAKDMLLEAGNVADRIDSGIQLLVDPDVLEAFRVANRAVARAFRQREAQKTDHKDPDKIDPPRWRPFQLAYLLMTMRGIVEPVHADRNAVDLLFFPTGGGKTEAYLALAAFTLVLRRLKSKGADGKPTIRSCGVSVLMRYTLRLLTLDQLSRAAGLICALELERQQNEDILGHWPFEIGLWVGQAATPNLMGGQGDRSSQAPYTAYTKTRRFQQDTRKPSPIPLEECPWCGTKFSQDSFRLVPNPNRPTDLRVNCANYLCSFSGDRYLPIVAVDEPIYRRLPCFLIATVDKFAALPWTGHTGTLFGKVDRYDEKGFYGPCDQGRGSPIPGGNLPGIDLIIQDELHLISGPLGTVAALYETVIDKLASRDVEGKTIRPKIIASTATVRRADSQIRSLFGRSSVTVFPPPGPDRKDSFFAETIPPAKIPARLYVGIAAQGRSLKVVLLRAGLALLSAGQRAWIEAGGAKASPNPADPYLTMLGYFNSLRELGGSRRIIEDEVRTRLAEYGTRKRRDPQDGLFVNRDISYEILELTSRVSTNDVATAKRRLAVGFADKERVDVALATNMISVGLDIVRLGLMVVLGQPKTSAEYIQATSRVGRDPQRPGLVVTLLNIHKPRDRSHYERFSAYHASFYRSVEPTSVTPFSPRALDRALSGVLVGLCRQQVPRLTAARGANEILAVRAGLDAVIQPIVERARDHRNDMAVPDREALFAGVLSLCRDLLDDWLKIANKAREEGSSLQYQKEEIAPPRRLLYDFLHADVPNLSPTQRRFRANRSMRDVEPAVDLFVQNLKEWMEKDVQTPNTI